MHIGATPQNKKILMIDSGVGGLSIARAITERLPTLDFHYIADDLGFPYGGLSEDQLSVRVLELVARACDREKFNAVVIACNTASTCVLPNLRTKLDVPVIGTVPAIKPASRITKTAKVSILATPQTIASSYLHKLIETHAKNIEVTTVASPELANLAELNFLGTKIEKTALLREITPAFIEAASGRTDTIVLGCTHYPLLIDELKAHAPWPVNWLDPSHAIAKHLARVLFPSCLNWGPKPIPRKTSFEFTSGKACPEFQILMEERDEIAALPSSMRHLTKGAVRAH